MNTIAAPRSSELDIIIRIKKYAYLLVILPSLVLFASAWLGEQYGYRDVFAFTTVFFVFALVVVFSLLLPLLLVAFECVIYLFFVVACFFCCV